MTVRWQIEPLGRWAPRPVTEQRRNSGVFRASWDATLRLLLNEVDHLGGEGPIAIRVDVERGGIRQDGMLYARALVDFPGVVVSFTSRFGPLSYATDAYEQRWHNDLTGWQANVRAIALALQALRDVDRWGVSRSGEQYTGWRALPAGIPDDRTRACLVLLRHAGGKPAATPDGARQVLADNDLLRAVWGSARRHTHPDRNAGDHTAWHAVEAAAGVLGLFARS